jgi:hypothetical protein
MPVPLDAVFSIATAVLLLLSLPEIAQRLDGSVDIWLTSDSIIGLVFGANTLIFATIESFFFGFWIVLVAILIVAGVWFPSLRPS